MATNLYSLTDAEAVTLDGHVSDDTQRKVDEAKARIAAVERLSDVDPKVAAFIADAISTANEHGLLRWAYRDFSRCGACGVDKGYAKYKSGPRKGEPNYKKPLLHRGVELDPGMVSIQHRAKLGLCPECITSVTPLLVDELRAVTAQLPDKLRHPDDPPRVKYDNRRCTHCGWEGHEGQMRQLPTVMPGGTYPGGCPQCPKENYFLGPRVIESIPGFVVVERSGEG